VFQWHRYTFDIPAGGRELARSRVCSQAFRLAGPAWGIQFHAEVTLGMLSDWSREDADELPMPAGELLEESQKRIGLSNALGRALCSAFLREASA
jgi:GMP synthase-like glutamine amidotransferase